MGEKDPEESESPRERERRRAIALRYGEEDNAPRVVAAGVGEIARRILDLAKEHKVPVHRDDSLVAILGKLNIGAEIPVETYRLVAELLAFLFRTDLEYRKRSKLRDRPS